MVVVVVVVRFVVVVVSASAVVVVVMLSVGRVSAVVVCPSRSSGPKTEMARPWTLKL